MMPNATIRIVSVSAALFLASVAWANPWRVESQSGSVRVKHEGVQVAEYVYSDPKITRPYFTNLKSPAGVQVTRSHPPVAGEDRMDHPDYHPGVWLAFGDLRGADNWRLRARVEHVRFIQTPVVNEHSVVFAVENRYTDADGATVCMSRARHSLTVTDHGLLLTHDETFSGDEEFTYGDQEEMGLGVRVATPLRVEDAGPDPAPIGNGEIAASGGRRGSGEVWGQPADWVDYRGTLDGAPAGLAIFCHPQNHAPSRMHARDYGFICANPFAMAAFKAGEPRSTVVQPGESLRLRYAVLCHSGAELSDEQLDTAYRAYAD